MKLSIKDYANMKSITPQAVYQAVSKGKLSCIIEDDKKWIVVASEDVKPVVNAVDEDTNQIMIKDLMKQLKSKDKQIKSLTKQLIQCSQSKEDVLLKYIVELKRLKEIPAPAPAPNPAEDDFIEVDGKKKGNKKGKKKGKKKK